MTTDPTRFILVQPRHAGNVGAAARAIKVMGFSQLVLVQPRWPDITTQADAVAWASGAADVLAKAQVVDSLAQALPGVTHVLATAMTPRDFGPPTFSPRQHLPARAADVQTRGAVLGFVFGTERYGLANEDVYRCHACLQIPAAADYGSLNLAQAVQVIAYEWRQALGGFEQPADGRAPTSLADAASVQGLLAHWQQALVDIGFLDPASPKKLMPRLNQLLNRAELTADEVHILRGIARAAQQRR
jgi:tRNA/rRNA methyltransferase